MIIQCDKEGIDAITALVDIALKVGGLQNLQKINQILTGVKPLVPPQENGIEGKPNIIKLESGVESAEEK